MGTKEKKGTKGNVVKYIVRSKAVKKLQISLAQFRRLCILKGIYPVEPKNKRKVTKGATTLRTYYHRKDIQFLLHEPLLRTFREQRAHERRIKKALSKREFATASLLKDHKPEYTLDHIIRERYPSFVDALRDLDDVLSMVFLFATLPAGDKISSHHVRECQRLSAEFQHYVMVSRSLRKVFISIKGIYYSAEIHGQTVTWVTPHQFSQEVPLDVDFRVMATFLDLHETLLGFVNFKLYSGLNLVYPPKIDMDRDAAGGGLASFVIETRDRGDLVSSVAVEAGSTGMDASGHADNAEAQQKQQPKLKQMAKRIKSIEKKLAEFESKDEDDVADDKMDDDEAFVEDDAIPVPLAEPATAEEIVPTLADWVDANQRATGLFSTCVFWLSREVPRYSLEFIIKSFGGRVGWDATAGSGSPFEVNDPRITHHICDRSVDVVGAVPNGVPRFETREYIQPQWVYDCINAGKLLRTTGYHLGELLPAHLSPFVTVREGDYVPEEAGGQTSDVDDVEEDEDVDSETEMQNFDDEADSKQSSRQAEFAAETAGVKSTDYEAVVKARTNGPKKQRKSRKKAAAAASASTDATGDAAQQEAETHELARMMMRQKDRRLYNKMQFGKNRKAEATEALKKKKAAIKKQQKQDQQKQQQQQQVQPPRAQKKSKTKTL